MTDRPTFWRSYRNSLVEISRRIGGTYCLLLQGTKLPSKNPVNVYQTPRCHIPVNYNLVLIPEFLILSHFLHLLNTPFHFLFLPTLSPPSSFTFNVQQFLIFRTFVSFLFYLHKARSHPRGESVTVSFLLSVRPSVKYNNSRTVQQIFMKLDTRFHKTLSHRLSYHLSWKS